ncbi:MULTISPECIES: WXG100 family type VII secretion target [Nocardia]|uniref:WXG100 family type VII secretion target n=2 Tax=Nocardia TaxID=1817 RepID=A0A2T2YQS9_9NOCA|nr:MULTISPECIES: WXG100 family type VII secretion target [Nocardia]MBF6242217.1 WXG100 family type VII secretion target [Nocardia elegans]MBF6446952.1 WXG100 family type VII secretion target [Nocardia elegans]PPJ15357.1 hypothetical protein C5E44_20775 [Nocardia nova]PSR57836.1 hypothetical protein C8259_33140 [Nocardia nova]
MSDFELLSYNFDSIRDAGTNLGKQAQDITNELENFEKMFQAFITHHWTDGLGTTAFQEIQQKWRASSDDLVAKLAQLGVAVTAGGDHMQEADALAAKTFGL